MSTRISPITVMNTFTSSGKNVSYTGKSKKDNVSSNNDNPISRKGETMNLIKATFLGGMGLGARLLWEIFDGDFLFEHAGNTATKVVDKNKRNLTGLKKDLCYAGATVGILVAGVSAFAILYTALNAPKIAYKSKVNTFTKKKEMDVYINANSAEKGIYTELSNKAKSADDTERAKLKEQYMQMQMAKNEVPDFVKLKK